MSSSVVPAIYSPGPPCRTYTVAEACRAIGCESEDWFLDRVRSGTFPARRIVRALRFTDDDLAAILEACKAEPRGAAVAESLPLSTARSRAAGRRHA